MKNIFLMCNGRTGSSFLSGHFPSIDIIRDCNQYNAWEFFAMWPPNFWRNIHFLRHNCINVPPSLIDFMCDVYYPRFHEPFTKNNAPKSGGYKVTQINGVDKKPFMHDFPYTIDMLPDFIKAIEPLNLNYFLHKNISHANRKGNWSQEDVIRHADFVIVNYRRSILDTYISNVKASESATWLAHNYDEKYDNKIYWSKKAFLDFAEKYKSQYEDIKTALKKLNKPYFVVEYESFCKQPNQIQYLANKLKELGITDLDIRSANTVKQSKDRQEYESCFKEYHVKNFIKDYPSIKHETTYKF
jgi:hypothetical protein